MPPRHVPFLKRVVGEPENHPVCGTTLLPPEPQAQGSHLGGHIPMPEHPAPASADKTVIDAAAPPRLPQPETRWHFGAFTVWQTQRRLERSGEAVRLGPRSFDLLLQLLHHAGEFVGKDALLASVWAGLVVEEGSVRVHMSTLRKALGKPDEADGCKEWISSLPHRGYRFNGHVRREIGDTPKALGAEPAVPPTTKLPVRWSGLIGRERDEQCVLDLLKEHRLVSVVGAGGIGKTSLAIRVAESYASADAEMEVAFADLAPLISPDHVVGTIARSLGAAADLPDVIQSILQCIGDRQILLLVDNCEHMLGALALPLSRLLGGLPGLHVLATSREALRITGERVYRLAPLAVPESQSVTLAQAMESAAVRLLVERAEAAGAGAFAEPHGVLLAGIARRLDGIPLAIELVAARLAAQPVSELALRLDDHMRLHSTGNRAALLRHKTLAAALEWSIALLDENELLLLRRLSVFRGRFDVASALRIGMDLERDAAFDALISLANKSLVSFDSSDAVAPYRLLDTTRSYAAELLERSGEGETLLRRHADLMLDLMQTATAELPNLSQQVWGERHAFRLDDVRFALKVCLERLPDSKAACALVIASTPLWFHIAQVDEYRDTVAAALALVDRRPEADPQTASWLCSALVGALLHTAGPAPELSAAAERALAGALAVGSRMLELQARWGHCTQDIFRGAYETAFRNGEVMFARAQSWADPDAVTLAHRVMALSGHFCGRFALSRVHSEAALAGALAGARAGRMRANMFQVDAIVAAKAALCRTLWLQGETANALEVANDAVARAESAGNAVSLCQALYGACAVSLWAGERTLAGKWVPMMVSEARRRGLAGWYRYAEWFLQGLLLETSPDRLSHVSEIGKQLARFEAPQKEMLVSFCPDWLDDALVQRIADGEGQWVAAEVWRAAGWRSERAGDGKEAERLYLRAIAVARQQDARAWEQRAESSLAALRQAAGRCHGAS